MKIFTYDNIYIYTSEILYEVTKHHCLKNVSV